MSYNIYIPIIGVRLQAMHSQEGISLLYIASQNISVMLISRSSERRQIVRLLNGLLRSSENLYSGDIP